MSLAPRPRSLSRANTAPSPSSLRQSNDAHPNDRPLPDISSAVPSAAAEPSLQGHHVPVATESTPLLGTTVDLTEHEHVHEGLCDHGTFSPRPMSPTASMLGVSVSGAVNNLRVRTHGTMAGVGAGAGDEDGDGDGDAQSASSTPIIDGLLSAVSGRNDRGRRWASRMKSRKMQSSSVLAERHGVKDSNLMYLSYYLPVLVWAREYKWSYLQGDFIAALTIAGMYLPMALSLADNLAHVPAINGLYSFVFNPLMYALLGSCPSMVVGPEAPGSLLVGSVIKASIELGRGEDDDAILHAKICGVVAGMAGATVFLAGVARLGFLDSVLSRPFLRGFISAIGFVIFVDQLVPELGLAALAAATPSVEHGSSVDKLGFVFTHLDRAHGLTCAVAGASFIIIMACREVKRHLQPRYPTVAYFPDRFLVVVLSALLAYWLGWDKRGVAVLGAVEAASGRLFTFRWPFQLSHMTHIRDAMGTSFLIALLGFFESSVAAKGLGDSEAFAGVQLSPNRELIALGAANLLGACFMSLPAFGGYGRSKVNRSTGGKSPMSSIFLSLIALICVSFLLPYFYYIPKPVLSSMISVVAWSLIEECPADVAFFIRIRAWPELGLMLVIVLATIFYSLTLGIAIGVGLSLLQVIRHATRPRIQILGRLPGTSRFENAEAHPERLEFFEGCLIVKIPEPLTFANTGELKTRLRRLERYGTSRAHPALPRLRGEAANRNVIFDIHGVTSLDGSGTQVLEEIVREYRARGVRVFFSRGPSVGSDFWALMDRSGIVALVGGKDHFVADVEDALKMTEAVEAVVGEGCEPVV